MHAHFRSRDKYDGHTPFDSPLWKTPCYTQSSEGVTGGRILQEKERIFYVFCDLDFFDQITFIYELDLYSLDIQRMCK